MFSFLREQGPGDAKSHMAKTGSEALKNPSRAGAPDIMRGIDAEANQEKQEQEYLTVETRNKNARKSTIVLAVLFSIGMLCLWFMIKKSTPQTASASTVDTEETQIEMAITKLVGVESEMFNRLDKIVKKFYEFSNVFQVKVDELSKNPFKLEVYMGNMDNKSNPENQDISDEMMRQQQLRLHAKNLELLGIMQSDQGYCCMISDKILYKGDSIEGFKVRQISNDFVRLESETVGADANNKEVSGIQIVLRLLE